MSRFEPSLLTSAAMAKPLSRRSAIRTFAAVGLAFAAIGTATNAGAQSTQLYTVTTASNFRAGPGTNHPVMAVIPKGSTFTLNGQKQNNFVGVNYHGAGWVYAPLVVAAGTSPGDPVMVGEARTITAVNLRSGPSTGHSVLRVVSSGATVNVSNTVQSGFRYVVHQGLAGWMADQYISFNTGSGDTLTTTANLNLRAEPSLSAKVILVMPAGSTVKGLDGGSGQFRKVSFNGTTGWAATAYLN